MWQLQLPISVAAILLLLCIEYPLVTRTNGNPVCDTREPTLLQVLAVIQTPYISDDVKLLPDWIKGEEILPGAQLAIKEISDFPSLLNGYQLEVIPVRVPQCELNKGIVPFVKELTSNDNNIIGIVGYFCHNIAQHLSQLAHYWSTLVQISATSLENSPSDNSAPHLQHSILPLRESIASATVQLMQNLGWNKIAVISNQHPNFLDLKRAFLMSAQEHGIQIVTQLETFHSSKEYLQELQRFGVKIVVAFVPQSEAMDILCTAYLNGFKWPDYAWIFADISKPDTFKNHCQVDAVNNAMFLHLTHTEINPEILLPTGLNYGAYNNVYLEELEKSSANLNISLQSNPYADVLYDCIWAIALTINRSLPVFNERNLSLAKINKDKRNVIMDLLEEQLSQLSFRGTTGWLNFSHSAAAVQTSVEILQIQNGKSVQIGLSTNQLFLNKSVMGEIPSDMLNRIYIEYPIALTVILILLIVLCLALTTVSMFLFIYYRKEPAIRATSSTLSVCLFVGCYFLLFSSILHNITCGTSVYGSREPLRIFICMFDVSILNLGIDIIFATVIAKTLRIYFIFKTFGKVSRVCSDQGLSILISSILSVKIIMLIVWAILDATRLIDRVQFVPQSVPPYFRVVQECQSKQLGFWTILTFSFSTLLALVMVLLAILTRKIKRSDYKDSKKINVLVAALILDVCICAPLWIMFRGIAAPVLSWLVYGIASILAAVLCQVLLILPKIVPLVGHNYQNQLLTSWREITQSKSLD